MSTSQYIREIIISSCFAALTVSSHLSSPLSHTQHHNSALTRYQHNKRRPKVGNDGLKQQQQKEKEKKF